MLREARHPGCAAALAALASFVPITSDSAPFAQGLTTQTIRGTVRAADGTEVENAFVTVVNTGTGYVAEAKVRHGRFLVQGLEVGGPYTVEVERLGFHPGRREGVVLRLGEPVELEFVMQSAAIPVDTLQVAIVPFPHANSHGGVATTVPDSLIHRLPTLDRNIYSFVHLAPQISTKVGLAPGGISGGGVGFRFNNFLINGVSQRSSSGSQPPEFAGAGSLPFDAVSEYQILIAPYDVRYGDFAGALVNAVTRSGTNELTGSAFAYWRNDRLAGRSDDPYDRVQYGFSVGGPILRDRLHFFVASEFQHLTSPAPGPYVGQPVTTSEPVPVTAVDLARLEEVMRGYGLAAGSGGAVENGNPQTNLFGRLDAALPEWNSRAILWWNEADSDDLAFARGSDVFPLSTHASTSERRARTTAFQLQTEVRPGDYNDLLVSYRSDGLDAVPEVDQPIVRVIMPSSTGDVVTVLTGSPSTAQGSFFRSRQIFLRDDITLQLGVSHVATLGFEAERFDLDRGGVLDAYGDWTFSSVDSLEAGIAERFEIQRDFGSASAPIRGGQYAAYLGDQWRVGERVSLTMGVRADLLDVRGRAPYNPVVDSIFGRRTEEMPHRRVHLSPRLGFTWDLYGTRRDQIRGGMGIFTGRPPLAWYHSALSSYGVGIGVLRCGVLPTDSGLPPLFVPDYREAPTACAAGPEIAAAPRGPVDLLDRDLRMAQTLRASLAYDRQLPWDLIATGEVLLTRNISDFVFVNLNLEGPQGTDRHGRVLYGGPVGQGGLTAPALRSNFSEVIDLQNTSRNRSYQASASVEKRFLNGAGGIASYTYSDVRDAQTPLRVNNPGTVNWSSRAVSGRHEDLSPEISLNDVPHRVVLAGTYTAPWDRWSTVLSFYYVGESGSPFTYRAWGTGRRGDLNADGSNVNDPIYVPRDAFDTKEITFSGQTDEPDADNSEAAQAERVAAQQVAFERFIESTPCLRSRRGRILERNSCREPWSHTTVLSVRQAIPVAGDALEAEFDVFNVLDLLGHDGGRYRIANPALLQHVGQTEGPPESAQPIFRFDTTAPRWTMLETESAYQLQLAVRYRF
jgi:hypothetical protein